MPVVTNHEDFVEAYKRHRSASPKRKPRTPSPTNRRQPERQPELQPGRSPKGQKVSQQASKLWKVMHHPEWGFNPHPEACEFFELGEYWVCVGHPSTPKSTVDEVNVGDRFVIQPKTTIGKRGKKVKKPCPCDKDIYRFGTVRSKAINVGGDLGINGWVKFKVDWTESIPYNGRYKNSGQKTITLQ